jgi:hypothetical protein
VFGKANSSAIDLSAIADASNPLGGFVINGEAAGDASGYNQIIQAITVDIACTGDCVTTTITCHFTIDNKPPCWVVCIGKANSSAINLSAIADASNPLGGHLDQWHYCRLYQTQHKIYLHLNW